MYESWRKRPGLNQSKSGYEGVDANGGSSAQRHAMVPYNERLHEHNFNLQHRPEQYMPSFEKVLPIGEDDQNSDLPVPEITQVIHDALFRVFDITAKGQIECNLFAFLEAVKCDPTLPILIGDQKAQSVIAQTQRLLKGSANDSYRINGLGCTGVTRAISEYISWPNLLSRVVRETKLKLDSEVAVAAHDGLAPPFSSQATATTYSKITMDAKSNTPLSPVPLVGREYGCRGLFATQRAKSKSTLGWSFEKFLSYLRGDKGYDAEPMLDDAASIVRKKASMQPAMDTPMHKSRLSVESLATPYNTQPGRAAISRDGVSAEKREGFDQISQRIEQRMKHPSDEVTYSDMDVDSQDDDGLVLAGTNAEKYSNSLSEATEQQKKWVVERLQDLSEQDNRNVDAVLRAPSDGTVVIDKFRVELTRRDFHSLHPGAWLNDEIINFYMQMLKERDDALCEQMNANNVMRKASHFFSSLFLTRLLNIGGSGKYEYNGVKRWTKKIDIFDMKRVFIPINIQNSHWTLLVVFIEEKTIQFFDSMNGAGTHYLETIRRWLVDELQAKKGVQMNPNEWKLVSRQKNVPQQGNGYDCGVFSCICADYISDDLPIECYSQQDMPLLRRKMGASILRGHLDYSLS